MVVSPDPDRLDAEEVRQRAEELEQFTNLSEREAFVWAAREESPRWQHKTIAEDMGVSESASQEYLSRAKAKAAEAKRTHLMLNENERGPVTGHEPLPVPEDINELSIDEMISQLRVVEHWMSMGILELYNEDMDLQKRWTELADAIIPRLTDLLSRAEALEERVTVRDTEIEGTYNEQKIGLSREGSRFVFHTEEGREKVTEEKMLELLTEGRIKIVWEESPTPTAA